ncbi:uncharacterized protein LOC111288936 [Durio zibethinus]|uniref:Uncharacterized protein LOC111288936 n=1 Tax=Durio zibethinus TaxID=66656 RepID=A0A6P5Y6I5_DURZI|nr:uncharacterized protein LOC111288936 [Durio zibethinus]
MSGRNKTLADLVGRRKRTDKRRDESETTNVRDEQIDIENALNAPVTRNDLVGVCQVNPSQFEGSPDPLVAEAWVKELEKLFKAMQSVKVEKGNEFLQLQQKHDMSVLEYPNKFNELESFYTRIIDSDKNKAIRFEHELKPSIRSRLSSHIIDSYKDVLQRALKIESDMKRYEQEMGDKKRSRFEGDQSNHQKNVRKNISKKWETKSGIKLEKCDFCERFHSGPCFRKARICFECEKYGHTVRNYLNKKNDAVKAKPMEQPQKGNARVFTLTRQDANANDNVVTGIVPINRVHANVLFDSGASHSFVYVKFFTSLSIEPEKLNELLYIATHVGKIMCVVTVYKNYVVHIGGYELLVDLV